MEDDCDASNPSLLDMIKMPYEEGKAALTRAGVPFRDHPNPPPTYYVVTPKCANPGEMSFLGCSFAHLIGESQSLC